MSLERADGVKSTEGQVSVVEYAIQRLLTRSEVDIRQLPHQLASVPLACRLKVRSSQHWLFNLA